MTNVKPLFKVFEGRAQGIGHLLRGRVWRMDGFASNEPLTSEQVENADGTITLRFRRKSDGDACIEFSNITAAGLGGTLFGEETILQSEALPSQEEDVINEHGVADVEVNFRELFSKTDGEEDSTTKSAGTSVSVTVSATESIEGVAEFGEEATTEAHAEISETSSSTTSTTKEAEAEETTVVPKGENAKITGQRIRADTQQELTAHGQFTFGLTIGKHSDGKFHGKLGQYGHWDSWADFSDVVRQTAPDNLCLAQALKAHPVWHADLWALDGLDSEVKYNVKYEGRIKSTYIVERF